MFVAFPFNLDRIYVVTFSLDDSHIGRDRSQRVSENMKQTNGNDTNNLTEIMRCAS